MKASRIALLGAPLALAAGLSWRAIHHREPARTAPAEASPPVTRAATQPAPSPLPPRSERLQPSVVARADVPARSAPDESSGDDVPKREIDRPEPGEASPVFYRKKLREEESRSAVLAEALAQLQGTRQEVAEEPDQPPEASKVIDRQEELWSMALDVHRWRAERYRERLRGGL